MSLSRIKRCMVIRDFKAVCRRHKQVRCEPEGTQTCPYKLAGPVEIGLRSSWRACSAPC